MLTSRSSRTSPSLTKAYLERIQTHSVKQDEEFLQFLNNDLEHLLKQSQKSIKGSIGVIVLDSLAGIFRLDEQGNSTTANSMRSEKANSFIFVVRRHSLTRRHN